MLINKKKTQHRFQGELKYVEMHESQIKILNKLTKILKSWDLTQTHINFQGFQPFIFAIFIHSFTQDQSSLSNVLFILLKQKNKSRKQIPETKFEIQMVIQKIAIQNHFEEKQPIKRAHSYQRKLQNIYRSYYGIVLLFSSFQKQYQNFTNTV
ncbi:hypothetical protein ABPG72_008231 [Tetrahymena utriculariae]